MKTILEMCLPNRDALHDAGVAVGEAKGRYQNAQTLARAWRAQHGGHDLSGVAAWIIAESFGHGKGEINGIT